MLFLKGIALFGFFTSLLAHIGLLFKMDIPRDELAVLLNTGLVLAVLARVFMTRNLRRGNDWFWDPSIKNIAPKWLKSVTVLVFTYGIIIAVVSIIGMVLYISTTMTESDYIIASRRLFLSVFSMLIACYGLEFMLNYSFRMLKSEHDAKLNRFDR